MIKVTIEIDGMKVEASKPHEYPEQKQLIIIDLFNRAMVAVMANERTV